MWKKGILDNYALHSVKMCFYWKGLKIIMWSSNLTKQKFHNAKSKVNKYELLLLLLSVFETDDIWWLYEFMT